MLDECHVPNPRARPLNLVSTTPGDVGKTGMRAGANRRAIKSRLALAMEHRRSEQRARFSCQPSVATRRRRPRPPGSKDTDKPRGGTRPTGMRGAREPSSGPGDLPFVFPGRSIRSGAGGRLRGHLCAQKAEVDVYNSV